MANIWTLNIGSEMPQCTKGKMWIPAGPKKQRWGNGTSPGFIFCLHHWLHPGPELLVLLLLTQK